MYKFTNRDYNLVLVGAVIWQVVLWVDEGAYFPAAAWTLLALLRAWRLPNGWNLRLATHRAYNYLRGFMPVTVYVTYGPEGSGPWFDYPEEAAEFIREESIIDAHDNPDDVEVNEVTFPQSDLDELRNGHFDFAEWHGWRIERMTIRKRDKDREWEGW